MYYKTDSFYNPSLVDIISYIQRTCVHLHVQSYYNLVSAWVLAYLCQLLLIPIPPTLSDFFF